MSQGSRARTGQAGGEQPSGLCQEGGYGGQVWVPEGQDEVGAAGRADQGLVGEGTGLGSPSVGQL